MGNIDNNTFFIYTSSELKSYMISKIGIFLVVVTPLISFSWLAVNGLPSLRGYQYAVNVQIRKKCRNFQDKELRRICKYMSVNPHFKENNYFSHRETKPERSRKKVAVNRRARLDKDLVHLKLITGKHNTSSSYEYTKNTLQSQLIVVEEEVSSSNVIYDVQQSRPSLNKDKCTTLLHGGNKNQMSISPWEYYVDVDTLRFPKEIVFARCLCQGCIDISSELEDFNLVSELLTIRETVIIRKSNLISFSSCNLNTGDCELKIIDIPIGCHCRRMSFV